VSEIVAQAAVSYGMRLSEGQRSQLDRYVALIGEWSARVNLVGNPAPDVVQRRHVVESIALGAALREREVLRPGVEALDVGAGAGFPGIVLKVAWPELRLTLLEATAKKAAFLRATVADLGLESTSVVAERAETAAHDPALRGRFDLVFARAVAPLAALVELTLPFLRVGGRLVAPKGSRAEAELAAARSALSTLGGRAFVLPFDVEGPPQRLVVVVQQRPAPAEYPRRPGVPRKTPIGT
jgi:16S rRNA (guanine527-N7)-methyltransferase